MTEIIHADIFFFITAIAVVVVSIGLLIALYYVIDILRDVRVVMKKVRKASDELEQDFEDLRANIKKEGVVVRTIFELAVRFITRQIPGLRMKKEKKETSRSEG
jgi:hypothetical protein